MSLQACEAYWQEFLRRPKNQRETRLEQKRLTQQAAESICSSRALKLRELEVALEDCSSEQRTALKPLLHYPGLLETLYNALIQCGRDGVAFGKLIETEGSVKTRIKAYLEELKTYPEAYSRVDHHIGEVEKEAKRPLDDEDLVYLRSRTWRDLPASDIADRMSKGEICPREEWIPGVSSGKRPLEQVALEQHLAFGERLAREGREAFSAENYTLAFTRFKQGVELLNWVQAKDVAMQSTLDDMYAMFLRNTAQAALKLERFQEAIRACTTIIQELDEHDSKARYRRGRAYMLLGMVKQAKDDFLYILKSPYSDAAGVQAARRGLRELRDVVSRSEQDTKVALLRGLSKDVFSEGRYSRKLDKEKNSSETDLTSEIESEEHTLCSKMCSSGDAVPVAASLSQEPSKDYVPVPLDVHCNSTEESGPDKEDFELSLEDTKNALIDLLDVYTVDPVASQLKELRSLADYDFRRLVIRARKYLPSVQDPVLDRYGLSKYAHREKMTILERSVSRWRRHDPEVDELRRECIDAIFGDVAEID